MDWAIYLSAKKRGPGAKRLGLLGGYNQVRPGKDSMSKNKFIVRIEAVISAAGNDEAYVGMHLGNFLLGRPLQRMVVTFEEELTEQELLDLRLLLDRGESIGVCKELRFGTTCLPIYDFRVVSWKDRPPVQDETPSEWVQIREDWPMIWTA